MSVNPHVLQYLDGKLAATGSQALPYDEWSKPALRDERRNGAEAAEQRRTRRRRRRRFQNLAMKKDESERNESAWSHSS